MAYFRKHDNGLWEYRISYKTPDGSYKQKSKRGFRTKKEAQIEAGNVERALADGYEIDKNVTLALWFENWMKIYKKPSVSEATYTNYIQTLRNIKIVFGSAKLHALTPSFYQKKLNDFSETHTKGTVARFHAHIKASVEYAINEGKIKRNFCNLALNNAKVASKSKDAKFLELDEYLEVIEISKSKIEFPSYFCIYLIAKTGMRFSEALGLTWDDIDFSGKVIHISKSWDYNRRRFKPTKTRASNRDIPVDDDFLEILKYYKKEYWEENEEGRLIKKLDNTSTNKTLRKITRPGFSIHGLRHTYASFLISNNIELLTISEILGHENISITMKVYIHQLASLRDKNTDKVRKIWGAFGVKHTKKA